MQLVSRSLLKICARRYARESSAFRVKRWLQIIKKKRSGFFTLACVLDFFFSPARHQDGFSAITKKEWKSNEKKKWRFECVPSQRFSILSPLVFFLNRFASTSYFFFFVVVVVVVRVCVCVCVCTCVLRHCFFLCRCSLWLLEHKGKGRKERRAQTLCVVCMCKIVADIDTHSQIRHN